jgi:uncharacterized integral membrane protein (TIGR00698 family)
VTEVAAKSVCRTQLSQARSERATWWLGMLLAAALAGLGITLAQLPWMQSARLSPLTLTIILGIIAGNTFFPAIAVHTDSGVDFAKTRVLRAGIVLYGIRITFQQIAAVGWAGALIDALMLGFTFVLAVQLGTRVFKLDRQTSMLIGAGSAICGAAAVMATEPVVRAQAHKVSIAVATVVTFGTLSMFIYPLLYPHLGLSEQAYGTYVGSTIHEVAQVVVAGKSIGDAAANTAVIEKMLRVMMLAPFLVLLSGVQRRPAKTGAGTATQRARHIMVPWFAVLFIAVSAINSRYPLPPAWSNALIDVDTFMLAMAMGALGLRTHIGAVRQAGARPVMLASSLFAFLIIGGYVLNRLVMQLLG